jgi:AcrR family transcriptional regulator
VSSEVPGFDVIWLREATGAAAAKAPPLSREQIVRAAIDLADEAGLEAASVRRIAARLGAGATSLYWHVRSKNDLHELMFDAAFAELELPPEPAGDWRADLRCLAMQTRDIFSRHPWLILLGIQPGIGPNIRRYAEFALRVVSPLGLDRAGRTEVLAILNNYLLGFAHRQTAWQQVRERAGLTDEQWEQQLGHYLAQVRASDPALAADIETRLHLTSDYSFELGLDCVLDGIEARAIPR